jgi:hypothetical protein
VSPGRTLFGSGAHCAVSSATLNKCAAIGATLADPSVRFILHDWDDSDSVQISKNYRRAMRRDSRLIVIENCLAEPGEQMRGPSGAIALVFGECRHPPLMTFCTFHSHLHGARARRGAPGVGDSRRRVLAGSFLTVNIALKPKSSPNIVPVPERGYSRTSEYNGSGEVVETCP